MTASSLGAILLVGGRSTRLGGGFKPMLDVGGQTLLARVVTAARDAGCAPIIAVGPDLDPTAPVRWMQEDPPFSGPAAAIAAALTAVDDQADDPAPEWMLVLAGDLPHADAVVTRLATALASEAGQAVAFTAGGRPQWLAGAYRTDALREAVHGFGRAIAGASCRALLGGLEIAWLADDDGITADVDTPADLARVRAAFEEEPVSEAPRTLPPEALDEWALALRERFGLAADDVPVALILDLARDVANGVARPAAPFSAFVAGLVAGRAGGAPEQVREAVAAVVELADGWKES
ncbi:NTP transferase domain-containing protein [Microbacterium sp. NPDC089318]